MEMALETFDLTKNFKNLTALNGLSLKVKKGETYGFLGPNGAGKTTTIKMITGFLRPTCGRVEIWGHDVQKDGNAAKSLIGIVPDQFGFYDVLDADDHLMYYGRLYGMERARIKERADELLDLVGLGDRRDSKVKTYSHGMKQRLAIAQALLNEPKLLLLDEPTTGLDPVGAFETRQLVKKLTKGGLTIFMSSHILSEVQDICDKVGIISRGTLVREDTIENLQAEVKNLEGRYFQVTCYPINDGLIKALEALEGVESVESEQTWLKIRIKDPGVEPTIIYTIVQQGVGITQAYEVTPSLEQVFLQFTGKEAEEKAKSKVAPAACSENDATAPEPDSNGDPKEVEE